MGIAVCGQEGVGETRCVRALSGVGVCMCACFGVLLLFPWVFCIFILLHEFLHYFTWARSKQTWAHTLAPKITAICKGFKEECLYL